MSKLLTLTAARQKTKPPKALTDLTNKEAAFIVASIVALSTVLQIVHVSIDESDNNGFAPAVKALVKSSEEVLNSRINSVHRAFTQNMARRDVLELTSFIKRCKITPLEQAIGIIEYLEYLRIHKVGMSTDELYLSLTVYSIASAYNELIKASHIDVSKVAITKLQDRLLHGLM